MTSALLAAFALATLPAASPLSLPEGVAPTRPIPALPAPISPAKDAAALAAAPLPLPTSAAPLPAFPMATATSPVVPGFASSSPSPWGLGGGALIILALGGATLWMRKRKAQGTRHIQVVETASLGPKRSLALVVVGHQSMLLSCCDSGIFLVSSQPATPEMLQSADQSAAGVAADAEPSPLLRPVETPRAAGGFAVQLAEAEETQGLRRRLSEAGVLR